MFPASYWGAGYWGVNYWPPLDVLKFKIDRTDAPLGQTGAARKWLRASHEDFEDRIEDALGALERAKKKPRSKRLRKRAIQAVEAVASVGMDPEVAEAYEDAKLDAMQGYEDALNRAILQLLAIRAAIEAFRQKDKQEEDALIALLLSI